MTAIVVIEGIALLVLFCCSAFFSSAETALFSLNSVQVHRLSRRRPTAGKRIEKLLEFPTKLLSTILIGNTLVNVVASVLGFTLAEHLFDSYGEAIAIPSMTLFLLVFGEIAPKRLAITQRERLSVYYAKPLIALITFLHPLRLLLEHVAGLFSRDSLDDTSAQSLSEDEFLTVVEVGEEEGVLDEEERTMVDGIIRLEETQACDVMTPRVDIVAIDLDDPPDEQEQTARSVQFPYVPLFRESLDNVEGFLDVPKFLLANDPSIKSATIKPAVVPETAPLDQLLTQFQKENQRVAIVLDEFGGTAGLITRGDILEEIVDDVDNEYREAKLEIQLVGDNSWLIDGSTSLEEINYELDTDLEAEGADRIGGWVSAQTGRIPRTGEVVEAQKCRVTVQRVRKHRVMSVLLEKLSAAEAAEVEA